MKIIVTKPTNTVHAGDCGHPNKAKSTVSYSGKRAAVLIEKALDGDNEYKTCDSCHMRVLAGAQ